MLQQSMRRLVRPAVSSAVRVTAPCQPCACQCGAAFGSNGSQVRYARVTSIRSPVTRARENRKKSKVILATADERIQKVVRDLGRSYRLGQFSTAPEEVNDFIYKFKELEGGARGGLPIDPTKMRKTMDAHWLDDKDSWMISHYLMVTSSKEIRYLGKKMLLAMSCAGVEEATIRVMAHVVLEARKKPEKMRAKEIQQSKRHLSQIASKKQNFRAMVCEGKVARVLGDESRAIEMWTDAMAAAVEDAAREEQGSRNMEMTGTGLEPRRDSLELSSPWIELMLLHRERSERRGKDEMAQCWWAMEVGCKQDDPTSFYHASTFVKQHDAGGLHVPTSEWLYYVTKAAASSHPIAAYELARFYAESGWKYLEDEPPDHVKPTPFDSFPTPVASSLISKLLASVGLKRRPEIKAEDSVFHNAAFPHTAQGRFLLAIEWLQVAIEYTYAPAYLFGAKLFMQKTLWARADAPQAAISMSDDRYTYASKEDYEAGIPIERPVVEEPADPPNPFYNVRYAQAWLREVFFAHEAYHYSLKAKNAYSRARSRGLVRVVDDEDEILSTEVFEQQGVKIQKWFRFPSVREMYEGELGYLYNSAKDICDKQGWNIYDYDNALIYKAGSGEKRAIGEVYLDRNL